MTALPVTISAGGKTLVDGNGAWLATCRSPAAAQMIADTLNGTAPPRPASAGGQLVDSKALTRKKP